MFIFDTMYDKVMESVIGWTYDEILGFLSEFFTMMNGMGAEIFTLSWIKSFVKFFGMFGWALFTVGLVVAIFDTALEAQNGKLSIKETGINILKGFVACSLFTTLPVELYKFSVSLQGTFIQDLIGLSPSTNLSGLANETITAGDYGNALFLSLFLLIAIGYCIIKVFFSNIKRGGILLMSIAVGSLYMFSIPRGFVDGFTAWCKQIIALCVTSFLQVSLLMAGLITFKTNMLLGTGIMLASGEVPRIAQHFGLDTSTRANLMAGVHVIRNTTRSAVNLTQNVIKKFSK